MNVLFIHDAFPAQFGRLGLELTRRHGWRCSFLVQSLSSCPTPTREMLETLELHQMPLAAEHRSSDGIPWPQIYGQYLDQCRSVFDAVRSKPQLRPDLIVAHGGRGAPTLFLREVVDCPIIIYCEYYFANSHRDISYRIDLPPAEPAPFFPRCINAPTLATLVDCDAGYSATHWQKQSFPRAVPLQDRGPFRRDRDRALPPRPGAAADRRDGDSGGTRGRHVRLARAGVDPRLRPVHEGRRPDRPDAHRRALRGGRRRGDPLRLGQAAHRDRRASSSGS